MTLSIVTAAILWFVAVVVFCVLEGITEQLVTIWFAAGGLVAMFTALLRGPVWLQFLLFFVVSGVLLLLTRPFVKKKLSVKQVATNADAIIGTTGQVLEKIDNIANTGRVKVSGLTWKAVSENNVPIEAGATVLINRIEGVKVIVNACDNQEGGNS